MPASFSVEKTLSRARQAAKKQDWIGAVAGYGAVLAKFPNNKKAQKALFDLREPATQPLLQLAQAAHDKEDWQLAADHLEAATIVAPNVPAILNSFAECVREAGNAARGLDAVARSLAMDPDQSSAWMIHGQCLHEMNKPDEAVVSLQRALEITPGDARAYTILGLISLSQGETKKAKQYFEEGLTHSPDDASLHRYCAMLTDDICADDAHVVAMKKALAVTGAENPASASLQFSLFDVLHKARERSEAFGYLKAANAHMAKRIPYDFKSEAIIGAFGKTLISQPLPEATSGGETKFVFVTGLPRTGTTLMERILSGADGVQPCGELTIVQSGVTELMQDVQNRKEKHLKSDDIEKLRDRFLNDFAKLSDGSPVAVDKMPMNFRWLGFICAALPEAKVIHMNRDPQAVAWSLYRHKFRGRGHDFMYSFEDIARFMVFHRDMMTHWRKVLGNRVIDVNYTDLVSDMPQTTKSIARATNLEWSEAWLTPELAKNHVRTSSVLQVIKPVYTNSDDGWKAYEAQLAPMNAALKAAGLL